MKDSKYTARQMTNDFIAGALFALCLRLALADAVLGLLAGGAIASAYLWPKLQLGAKFSRTPQRPRRKFRAPKMLAA